jgi:hypothetical protein
MQLTAGAGASFKRRERVVRPLQLMDGHVGQWREERVVHDVSGVERGEVAGQVGDEWR